MSHSVICLAPSRAQAELIVDELRSAGFSSNDISALFSDHGTSRDFAHEKHTKAPEGIYEVLSGATVGGIAGCLIGLGLPEIEARRYMGKLKEGNILIAVHSEDSSETDSAKKIFASMRSSRYRHTATKRDGQRQEDL